VETEVVALLISLCPLCLAVGAMLGWLFRPAQTESVPVVNMFPGTALHVIQVMEKRGYRATVVPDERVARINVIFTK
jgi:uncharacterized membrane protein